MSSSAIEVSTDFLLDPDRSCRNFVFFLYHSTLVDSYNDGVVLSYYLIHSCCVYFFSQLVDQLAVELRTRHVRIRFCCLRGVGLKQ